MAELGSCRKTEEEADGFRALTAIPTSPSRWMRWRGGEEGEGRRGGGEEGRRAAQQASENHDLTKEEVQTVPPQLGPKPTFGSCTMTLVEG